MKQVLFLLPACIYCLSITAQAPLVKQWDARFGGNGFDESNSLRQTTDGGYIISGYSFSSISGDRTEANWDTSGSVFAPDTTCDYWIVKTDSVGNKEWDKRYGGSGNDLLYPVRLTGDGGYVLCGFSFSGVNGDKTQPNRDTTAGIAAPALTSDYWLIKIDSAGNIIWDKTYGGKNDDRLYAIALTTDGGFILGGHTLSDSGNDVSQTTRGGFDYWIIKTDNSGNKQWDKRFGGSGDENLFAIRQTADGGYLLGGFSFSGISGDKTQPNRDTTGGISGPAPSCDYWLVKTDSLGNMQWDKRFGGNNNDEMFDVLPTTDGGYLMAGLSNSDSTGDRTYALLDTSTEYGKFDYWLIKADSAGNKLWDRKFGGLDAEDEFGYLIQTTDGGYMLSGTSYSQMNGDKSEPNMGREQSWLVKTDFSGNMEWNKTIFTNGGLYHDEECFVIQDKDNCYLLISPTYADTGGYKTQMSRGLSDYWIAKFCDTSFHCNLASPTIYTADTLICANDSTQLCAPAGFTSYLWNNGAAGICSQVSEAGNYYVTVTDANNCTAESNHVNIDAYPSPPVSISINGDTLSAYNAVFYQWFFNGDTINGAVGSIYVVNQPGLYAVAVTDTNGCTSYSTPINFSGINKLNESGITVFPNPSQTGTWFLITTTYWLNSKIEVYDNLGRIVYQSAVADQKSVITVSPSSGIYELRLVKPDKNISVKLVKW